MQEKHYTVKCGNGLMKSMYGNHLKPSTLLQLQLGLTGNGDYHDNQPTITF